MFGPFNFDKLFGKRRRDIHLIVLHCSDSPDHMDIGAEEIRSWHLERGWSDIGYHFVVRRNGVVEAGRPVDKMGAHVAGHNKGSLGICWVGRYATTEEQDDALLMLVASHLIEHGLDVDAVRGHREVAPLSGKTCPNIDMVQFREDLRRYLRHQKCGTEVKS